MTARTTHFDGAKQNFEKEDELFRDFKKEKSKHSIARGGWGGGNGCISILL